MRLLAAVVVAVFTLAGCTIGNGTPTPTSETAAPPTAAPVTGASSTGASPAAPSAPSSEAAVLASRTTSYGSTRARVDLNELRVSGGVTTVNWTVTNTSDEDLPLAVGIGRNENIFGDGQAASVPGSDKSVEGDLRASDGVFIVDAVNKRRYLAARDDQGVCLCTSVDRFESLGGNRSKVFSAIYRAIPDGVDTVAVTVPGAGTFTGVPVQR